MTAADWVRWFLGGTIAIPVGAIGVSALALSFWDDHLRRKKARHAAQKNRA